MKLIMPYFRMASVKDWEVVEDLVTSHYQGKGNIVLQNCRVEFSQGKAVNFICGNVNETNRNLYEQLRNVIIGTEGAFVSPDGRVQFRYEIDQIVYEGVSWLDQYWRLIETKKRPMIGCHDLCYHFAKTLHFANYIRKLYSNSVYGVVVTSTYASTTPIDITGCRCKDYMIRIEQAGTPISTRNFAIYLYNITRVA